MNNFLKNSFIVILGAVISNILGYLFQIVAGRMMGPNLYGQFGSIMAFFTILTIPFGSIFSISAKFVSEYSTKSENNKIFKLNNLLKNHLLFASIIIIFLLLSLSNFLLNKTKFQTKFELITIGLLLLINNFYYLRLSIIYGLKKYTIISTFSIIEVLLRLLFFVCFLFWGLDYHSGVYAFALSYLLSFFLMKPYIKIDLSKSYNKNNYVNIKKFYHFVVYSLVISFLLQFFLNLPPLIINFYHDKTYTGYWLAAFNVAKIPMVICIALTQLMFTEISGLIDYKLKMKLLSKTIKMTLLINIIFIVIFYFFGFDIVKILYGKGYNQSVQHLTYMSIFVTVYSLFQIITSYIIANKKLKLNE